MWLSLVIIVLFGGATLLFKNDDFIKLKPSILYWLFSIGLLGGQYIFKKNGIKSLCWLSVYEYTKLLFSKSDFSL